jgi:hypothetical protein
MNLLQKILIITTIFSFVLLPTVVFAQDDSAEAETTEIDPEVIKGKVKERLQNSVLGENKDGSGSAEINAPVLNAYFGHIIEVDESSFVLQGNDGTTKRVEFTDETDIFLFASGVGNRTADAEDIETELFAITMGEIDSRKTLHAQRISLSPSQAKQPQKQIIAGKITEIDDESITLTAATEVTITVPSKYALTIQDTDDPEYEDLNIDAKAIAIVTANTNAAEDDPEYSLFSLYAIPSINNPIAEASQIVEEEATKSAETE